MMARGEDERPARGLRDAAEPTEVLLVEDSSEYALLVSEYLEQMQPGAFALQHVVRLSTGIEILMRGGIDVVLLDLTLPDSHGLDTYVTVRSQAPDVPVVVLTGVDDEQLAVQAAREGAQDYLVKGRVRGDGLVRCLQYAIERQQTLVHLRQLARRLSASETRFRRIIERNADAIVVLDPGGEVRFVNRTAEALLGKPADELLGQAFEFVATPGRTSEVIVAQGDGGGQVAEMRVSEIHWDQEPALLASLRDVTEHKRTREIQSRLEAEALLVEQLRGLDRMKSEFVHNVTDEMLAPLAPLESAVTALLDGSQGELDAGQREVLEMVEQHVASLARFATGVHTLSKLDSGPYSRSAYRLWCK